jgi:hypothetical protein
MRADLHDPPMAKHHDQVRHLDGREAVGDQHGDRAGPRGRPMGGRRVTFEERVLGRCIEARRRLVQQEQQWLSHHGPAERQFLPLAAG